MLAIMVRDVRDHTFSSLDCLWSLRTGVILPRAARQYELMIQRYVLHTNAQGQWVRGRTWANRSSVFARVQISRTFVKVCYPEVFLTPLF